MEKTECSYMILRITPRNAPAYLSWDRQSEPLYLYMTDWLTDGETIEILEVGEDFRNADFRIQGVLTKHIKAFSKQEED